MGRENGSGREKMTKDEVAMTIKKNTTAIEIVKGIGPLPGSAQHPREICIAIKIQIMIQKGTAVWRKVAKRIRMRQKANGTARTAKKRRRRRTLTKKQKNDDVDKEPKKEDTIVVQRLTPEEEEAKRKVQRERRLKAIQDKNKGDINEDGLEVATPQASTDGDDEEKRRLIRERRAKIKEDAEEKQKLEAAAQEKKRKEADEERRRRAADDDDGSEIDIVAVKPAKERKRPLRPAAAPEQDVVAEVDTSSGGAADKGKDASGMVELLDD